MTRVHTVSKDGSRYWDTLGKNPAQPNEQLLGSTGMLCYEKPKVDHPCITLTGMQLKEGDVKAHRAAVTE